jgi:hypothetical protein
MKTIEKYAEQINRAIERARADFTARNLLALRIAIDKYLWKKLNGGVDGSPVLKELVEELPPETSVQMLRWKIEFWKMKHHSIEYDPEKLAIVKLTGGESQ